MGLTLIDVHNLIKTYPGAVPTPALKGVSFSVAKGEFVAIMGRSGSGKSTLLHQLSLIDQPNSGAISIDGADVLSFSDTQKANFRLKHLGYVFQEFALVTELNALENVFFPAMALGTPATDYKPRAKELLELVELGHRLDHYPSELSGGEEQRVAIARALINRPKILFADEPTANLDSVSAQVVLRLFRKLRDEAGQTIVMVTHEPDDRRFVDRIITLKDGLVEKDERLQWT